MSRYESPSPFLGRDYRHIEHYAPASDSQADRDRRDRLKAKMLIERLLFKKWDRNGVLKWRWMQRLGDFGRREAIWYVLGLYAAYRFWLVLR